MNPEQNKHKKNSGIIQQHSKEQARPHKEKPASQLWASLYLPDLLLDTMQHDIETPIAVIERRNNRQQIRSCNHCASEAGLFKSMALNSAYAIVPALTVTEYDAAHEAVLLQQVGEWAMQFSSVVCLHPPNHVLIEIAGSKRLFESFEILATLIQQGLSTLGYNGLMGIAPTPLAANLLARANIRRGIVRTEKLPRVLKELSINYLELEPDTLEGLHRSGIRKIGNLLTVSPASLTRRFGPACVKHLDCLLGRHPDPRTPLRLTSFFERSLDLPLEVHDTSALQFATQRMISELAAFLVAHDNGLNKFTFTLRHEKHHDTPLQLRFLQATSQARHLHRVLSERLSQITLPAPVSGLHLLADEFSEIERDASDFFVKSRRQQNSFGEVIDKLCSRLGNDALYTLSTVDDHRPEKAWKKTQPGSQAESNADWPDRPLWLLEQPWAVTGSLSQRLCFEESDAERIETGWWDSTDVRRDYYLVRGDCGTRYWAYRQRGSNSGLFIHGIFS
ncbi:hypothetical protein AB833_17760 [Chromatiales bacterium (ex Bugula neritina AB1)]|nr:hypothetical protein AB833_17760 [Chromatiales bacterium (ex Bugula neritina AB1)]